MDATPARRPRRGGLTFAVALAAGAALLTGLLYRPTLGYGFYYDDYHFVRPYTAHEVRAAFHGPWDAARIEAPYYRPLTIGLYAVRFAVLGFNASAHHALSLILFALAATLFGVFAMRATGTRLAAAIGATAFIVHPGMPYAAAAWVTNQMHLAELLVVLTALLWWFAVRRAAPAWWMPLLVLQAAAFLLKEDGVMLLPAVVVLHTLRKYTAERDLPHVPIAFLASAAVLIGSLLAVRAYALEGTPARRLPSFDQAWTNWTRAFDGAFRLLPARRPWQSTASWFATLLPLAALALWRRLSGGARFTLAAGLSLGLLFELPFAFIVKGEQLHVVNAGAALVITAAAAGLLRWLTARRAALLAGTAIVAVGLAAMAAVSRDIMRDLEPFGPIVLHTDRIVQEWAAVPAEIREYLASKTSAPSRPDPDLSRALPAVAFGLHGRERSPDGVSLRWMAGPSAEIFVRRGTRLVTLPVRHEAGAFREPAHVRIEADGRTVVDAVLEDGRWRQYDVPLRQRAWLGIAGMHRIRVSLDHAWVPSRIIPGSGDGRTLGLQLGDVVTR